MVRRKPDPQALSGRKLHDRVAMALGVEITTGGRPEGSVLTEAEGVERFGVSRATYREAVRVLAAKGLVSSRAKTGTRVNPRSTWAMLDPELIAWMFSAAPSPEAVRSLFELRMIVEPAAAAAAAERRSAHQLLQIGRAFEDMRSHGYRSAEGQAADGRFHAAILQATNNDFLIGLTESIATAVRLTTLLKATASKTPRDPIPLHFDLYAAIANANPVGARRATEILISIAQQDTEASLRC